jgi:hypothetical protein
VAAAALTAAAAIAAPALASASPPGTPAVLAAQAAKTCVNSATRAGWPNNGYFGGALVTAAAICVAESHGRAGFYICVNKAGHVTGQGTFSSGHPVRCPKGTSSYYRGLWQLNTKSAAQVTDSCAFSAGCNAQEAYIISGRGTDFTPWASYQLDQYAQFIDLVQGVVNETHSGTVTSAELGECLAVGKAAAGAKLVVVNCGAGPATQQWTVTGSKLKLGSDCAAITSRTAAKPAIELARCVKDQSQDWVPFGRFELRNAADHKCLTDPGGALKAGTAVEVAKCANAKPQTWWLP